MISCNNHGVIRRQSSSKGRSTGKQRQVICCALCLNCVSVGFGLGRGKYGRNAGTHRVHGKETQSINQPPNDDHTSNKSVLLRDGEADITYSAALEAIR